MFIQISFNPIGITRPTNVAKLGQDIKGRFHKNGKILYQYTQFYPDIILFLSLPNK